MAAGPAVGGSIQECGVDGRRMVVAADADMERDLGGFTNSVESNGDGSVRLLKTRKPWTLKGLTFECNENRGDHKAMQDLADRKTLFPISVTLAGGEVYAGLGQIVGDLKYSAKNATIDIEFAGEHKLEKQ